MQPSRCAPVYPSESKRDRSQPGHTVEGSIPRASKQTSVPFRNRNEILLRTGDRPLVKKERSNWSSAPFSIYQPVVEKDQSAALHASRSLQRFDEAADLGRDVVVYSDATGMNRGHVARHAARARRSAMNHIAVDLGGRQSQICVRGALGEVLEEKRIDTDGLAGYLKKTSGARVILET